MTVDVKLNMFAGNGIDLCQACHQPTRDHALKPCPTLNVDVLYTPAPANRVSEGTGVCLQCGGVAIVRVDNGLPTNYCSSLCRSRYSRAQRRT